MSNDLYFQNISTVQSNLQPGPVSMTSAATIAPTTFLTLLTGTTAVATITPPVTGTHMLAIVSATTNFLGFVTSGNVLVASITNSVIWTNKVTLLIYNPLTGKYHPNFGTAA